jgi:hypothetical protein
MCNSHDLALLSLGFNHVLLQPPRCRIQYALPNLQLPRRIGIAAG